MEFDEYAGLTPLIMVLNCRRIQCRSLICNVDSHQVVFGGVMRFQSIYTWLLVVCSILLSLTLSVANAEPSESEIRAYVETSIDNKALSFVHQYEERQANIVIPISINKFAVKVFPGAAGEGRVSVAGTFSVGTNLYKLGNFLIEDLYRSGATRESISYAEKITEFRDRFKRGHTNLDGDDLIGTDFFRVSYLSGTTVPYAGEIRYQETVSGFRFDGGIGIGVIGGGVQIAGRVENEWLYLKPDDWRVVGTQAFNDLLAEFRGYIGGKRWEVDFGEFDPEAQSVVVKGVGPYDTLNVVAAMSKPSSKASCTEYILSTNNLEWARNNNIPELDYTYFIPDSFLMKIIDSFRDEMIRRGLRMDVLVEQHWSKC